LYSEDDPTFLIRISNLLHGSQGGIPKQFIRSFEGIPFEECTYCGKHLRSPRTLYRISKLYGEGELLQEWAICVECYTEVKAFYSQESLQALKQYYAELSFSFNERRRIALNPDLDRLKLLTDVCLFCKTSRHEISTYMLYSMFEADQIIYHPIRTRLVCVTCILELYELLSAQTKDDGRKFFEDYFGLPPELHPVEMNEVFIERLSKNS
jgi:hypothetical protein